MSAARNGTCGISSCSSGGSGGGAISIRVTAARRPLFFIQMKTKAQAQAQARVRNLWTCMSKPVRQTQMEEHPICVQTVLLNSFNVQS